MGNKIKTKKVKFKTIKSAAKRFSATGTGKVKRNQAYARHLKACKSPKRRRNLRKSALVASNQVRRVLRAIGAK